MTAKILYASKTGHSKKIANAIAKAHNLSMFNVDAQPIIENCDVLFIVSGIYGGQNKPELLSFVKKANASSIKQVALITTSTKGTAQGNLRTALQERGVKVMEEEYNGVGGFLVVKMFRPNEKDINAAVEFAGKILNSENK